MLGFRNEHLANRGTSSGQPFGRAGMTLQAGQSSFLKEEYLRICVEGKTTEHKLLKCAPSKLLCPGDIIMKLSDCLFSIFNQLKEPLIPTQWMEKAGNSDG